MATGSRSDDILGAIGFLVAFVAAVTTAVIGIVVAIRSGDLR